MYVLGDQSHVYDVLDDVVRHFRCEFHVHSTAAAAAAAVYKVYL